MKTLKRSLKSVVYGELFHLVLREIGHVDAFMLDGIKNNTPSVPERLASFQIWHIELTCYNTCFSTFILTCHVRPVI